VFFRRSLEGVEDDLDRYSKHFMDLDADIAAHCGTVPTDINSAMRKSAQMQLHFGMRDSARELLSDTKNAVSGLRSQLDFRGSLSVALIALIVSIPSLVSVALDVLRFFAGR
jgi:hypothetical protein